MASENFAVVQKFYALLSVGRLDEAFTLLDDSAQITIAQTARGSTSSKPQARERMNAMNAAFKGPMQVKVLNVVEQGDRLVIEGESYGVTHLDTIYQNRYATFFTLRNGKIMEVKEYNDSIHVMEILVPAMQHAQSLGR